MKISRSELKKKIHDELAEGIKWSEFKYEHRFFMMLDTSDADIWTDCFISENEWKVYHSDTIVRLTYSGISTEEQEKFYLVQAIQLLKEAGWEISE